MPDIDHSDYSGSEDEVELDEENSANEEDENSKVGMKIKEEVKAKSMENNNSEENGDDSDDDEEEEDKDYDDERDDDQGDDDEGDDNEDDNEDDDDSDGSEDEQDDEDEGDEGDDSIKHKQVKKTKKKTPEPPKRKIGPQKQKKEIHTHLKKAKKFEIRKITRRIDMLRKMKGTDEQKAKNNRKVDKLLIEMQAMKEFLIDQLTERMVDIFKGTSEQIYLDIWKAAQEHKEFEKMVQTLSNGTDENKYKHIAFLRMISSKDIIGKLKLIHDGTNMKKQLSKKALQKKLRKYNQKVKKLKKQLPNDYKTDESLAEGADVEKNSNEKKSEEQKKTEKKALKKLLKEKELSDASKDPSAPKKKKKKFSDPFFLPSDGNVVGDSKNEDVSDDEDFSAPVTKEEPVNYKKKNRMGQRARKQMMEREQAKSTGKPVRKQFDSNRKSFPQHKQNRPKFDDRKKGKFGESKKAEPKVDKNLHPSWQAKQKLKAQQGITEFSGTKITFED